MGDEGVPANRRVMVGSLPGELPSSTLKAHKFNSGSGSQKFEPDPRAPYVVLYNADSVAHTMTLAMPAASGGVAVPYSLAAGQTQPFPSSMVRIVTDGSPNGTVYAWMSDVGLPSFAPPAAGPTSPAASEGAAATVNATPSATGAFQMSGLGSTAAITPLRSGNVLIAFYGSATEAAAGDTVQAHGKFGTGSAPALHAAETGTTIGSNVNINMGVGNSESSWSFTFVVTGLTVGTAYWFDMACQIGVAGSIFIAGVAGVAELYS